MKSLRQREASWKRGSEPARKKFGRWFGERFGAPLIATALALSGGCIPRTPGQKEDGTDHTYRPDPCETISNVRRVNEHTTQEQELTYCEGLLMMEVSVFSPSLDDGFTRQSVWVGEREFSLLGTSPGIVTIVSKGTRYVLSPDHPVEILGGPYTLEVVDFVDADPVRGAYVTITDGASVLFERHLLRSDYSWYQFPLGNGTTLIADIYGLGMTDCREKSFADISVFRGKTSEAGFLVGYSEVNDETLVTLIHGYRVTTPDGVFHVEGAWGGHHLFGWTLSRADGEGG
ncbi:MAG: hypothetical protein AB1295_04375 [Candidatus Micrarchaeota archaeon]